MVGSRRPRVLVALVALLITAVHRLHDHRRPGQRRDLEHRHGRDRGRAGIACLVRAVGPPGPAAGRLGRHRPGRAAVRFGEGSWTWTETVRGEEVPFPGLPDVGYLGMVPLIAVGLLILPVAAPVAGQPGPQRRRRPDGRRLAAADRLDLRPRPADRGGRGHRASALYVLARLPARRRRPGHRRALHARPAAPRRPRLRPADAGRRRPCWSSASPTAGTPTSTCIGAYGSGGLARHRLVRRLLADPAGRPQPRRGRPGAAPDVDRARPVERQPFAMLLPYVAVLAALVCQRRLRTRVTGQRRRLLRRTPARR